MGRTPGELVTACTSAELTELFVFDHLDQYEQIVRDREMTDNQRMDAVLRMFGVRQES